MDKQKKYDYINQYKKEHLKRITLEVKKKYYDSVLLPYVSSKGLSVSGFIKRCIDYCIRHDIDIDA